jgi:signal transduction histidine kinase
LRTPLMVISSSCELLREEQALDASGQARLARIEAAAADMGERLDTYLMLARGGDAAERFARESAHTAARGQLAAWSAVAQRRDMRLTLEVAQPEAPALQFPAPLLRAVLSNLIRNSLQYAGPRASVVITAGPDFMQVADDGPGIAAERHEAVFSPFVRGEQPDAGNLGLGLSLVQRICAHQGWRVSLQSAPGRGTVFRVDLAAPASA